MSVHLSPHIPENFFNAFYGSLTSAFALTHSDFTPQLLSVRAVWLTCLLHTYAFLTIIIVRRYSLGFRPVGQGKNHTVRPTPKGYLWVTTSMVGQEKAS